MNYLSPEIEALAKRGKQKEKSLVNKSNSCGIFQDYQIEENFVEKDSTSM